MQSGIEQFLFFCYDIDNGAIGELPFYPCREIVGDWLELLHFDSAGFLTVFCAAEH